jgi:hypothetical protein
VIDDHYLIKTGKPAETGSRITMVVSSVKPESFDTTINLIGADDFWPEANYYIDTTTNKTVWLCPMVQVLFKGVPETIWIEFKADAAPWKK